MVWGDLGSTAPLLLGGALPSGVENVTDRQSNPFGMNPPCDNPVHGYGDANAHFHVVGDHPGVHGELTTGIPFTGTDAATRLQRALVDAGLLSDVGSPPTVNRTFLSYLHLCPPDAPDATPTDDDYARLEPFFDAELRAITAHVLLPVGERAIRHVLETYTAESVPDTPESIHATELRGGGFLVVPVREPADWTDTDASALVETLQELQRTDYRREVDLGRFLHDSEPYYVR